MITIYTLKTCDTCKRALKWLDEMGIAHMNKDIRTDGISEDTIARIVEAVGYESAVNRRSTTWKNLDEDAKSDLDKAKAASLLNENPTLMKRPVFMIGSTIHTGFDKTAMELLKQ